MRACARGAQRLRLQLVLHASCLAIAHCLRKAIVSERGGDMVYRPTLS